jgi:hypothetical protein
MVSIFQIVYIVFVPSLVFSSLAGTVTLKDVISWFGLDTTSFTHRYRNFVKFDRSLLNWMS